jgi:hypothetical protein
MTPGKMNGLLLPEPACVVWDIFIDARFKMTPALRALVFVLIPRASK